MASLWHIHSVFPHWNGFSLRNEAAAALCGALSGCTRGFSFAYAVKYIYFAFMQCVRDLSRTLAATACFISDRTPAPSNTSGQQLERTLWQMTHTHIVTWTASRRECSFIRLFSAKRKQCRHARGLAVFTLAKARRVQNASWLSNNSAVAWQSRDAAWATSLSLSSFSADINSDAFVVSVSAFGIVLVAVNKRVL